MDTNYKEKLIAFYDTYKRMPSYSEMMKLFGMKSKNAVYRLVTKMVAAGIVAQDRLGRLIPSDTFGEIPMVGSVKAGFPAVAEELREGINLEEMLMPHKESTYIFEVDGESMIDAHIADGDMVLVERTSHAKNGDIVIANVDGEFTMKYFKTNGKKTWLEPANKKFKPIYPEEYLTVVGVVKAVIRKY